MSDRVDKQIISAPEQIQDRDKLYIHIRWKCFATSISEVYLI